MRTRLLLLAALAFSAAHAESASRNGIAPVPAGRDLRSAPIGMAPDAGPIASRPGPAAPADAGEPASPDGLKYIYLRKAVGTLKMYGHASADTYLVYFHVPIPFHEQAPVLLQVDCPQMVDYRFVHEDPPNLLVAARLVNADSAVIDWTAWVLIKQNTYPGFPTYVPIPAPGELPDSVRQWLDTTDCCQVSVPRVQSIADSLRDTTTNLIRFAQRVCDFCRYIPGTMPHEPYGFDADYTLKWGNSCVGHAHAAAALLRVGGVPARTLLAMIVFGANRYDMHWIIDYYVPGYGWVRMEPSLAINPMEPQEDLVIRACNSSDEFPVWFPCAIDAEWHTSDTAYGMWYPDWGLAHAASAVTSLSDSSERVEYAIALTDWVFNRHSACYGIRLTPAQYAAFVSGLSHQTGALARIQARDLPGYIREMQDALLDYQSVNPAPVETLFSEDFEQGPAGWTHGGGQDEWELGVPTFGPAETHSGQNCWGTNLDGPYANNEDCWLASPPIDLSGLASANLSFWIWNRVQGHYGIVYDPVWVEISNDGTTFRPLSGRMGGVNDDPEITAVGGWSRVFLDLVQYLGDTVQVRFRFRSDGSVVFAGSYIDDVRVFGRHASVGVAETPGSVVRTANRLPTVVRDVLRLPMSTGIQPPATSCLLDACGRKVLDLHPGMNDVRAVAPGVYFVQEEPQAAGPKHLAVRKIVLTD
jgi:hypothetical protein